MSDFRQRNCVQCESHAIAIKWRLSGQYRLLIRQLEMIGSRDGAEVIASASHWCDPGSIPYLWPYMGWVVCCFFALLQEAFSRVFPSPQISTFLNFQFDRMQDLPQNHFRVNEASWVNVINLLCSQKKKKTESEYLINTCADSLRL